MVLEEKVNISITQLQTLLPATETCLQGLLINSGTTAMGVTNRFLIGFKSHSTYRTEAMPDTAKVTKNLRLEENILLLHY